MASPRITGLRHLGIQNCRILIESLILAQDERWRRV